MDVPYKPDARRDRVDRFDELGTQAGASSAALVRHFGRLATEGEISVTRGKASFVVLTLAMTVPTPHAHDASR